MCHPDWTIPAQTLAYLLLWVAVIKSIETPDINDSDGVPFQIFYGVSGNDHNFWSIANARKVIKYEPEDNSSVRFIDSVTKHIAAARANGTVN